MMDAIERAVVAPQVKIIEQRRARRQVLRDRPPLASRAQDIHDPVHHLPHVDAAPCRRAGPAGSMARHPFIRHQSGRSDIAIAPVVTSAVLRRPHR